MDHYTRSGVLRDRESDRLARWFSTAVGPFQGAGACRRIADWGRDATPRGIAWVLCAELIVPYAAPRAFKGFCKANGTDACPHDWGCDAPAQGQDLVERAKLSAATSHSLLVRAAVFTSARIR